MAYRYIYPYGYLKAVVNIPWVINGRMYVANTESWKIEDRCCICGTYILDGQNYFICSVPKEVSKEKTKHQLNFIVHANEWLDFTDGLSEEELIEKFLKLKTPRQPSFTLEQMDRIQAFKEACQYLGFISVGEDKSGLRMSHCRKKRVLVYNVYYDHIELKMSGQLKFMEVNPAYEVKKLMQELLFKKENCIL